MRSLSISSRSTIAEQIPRQASPLELDLQRLARRLQQGGGPVEGGALAAKGIHPPQPSAPPSLPRPLKPRTTRLESSTRLPLFRRRSKDAPPEGPSPAEMRGRAAEIDDPGALDWQVVWEALKTEEPAADPNTIAQ